MTEPTTDIACSCGAVLKPNPCGIANHQKSIMHRHGTELLSMLGDGEHSDASIARKLGVKRQAVYNLRIKMGLQNARHSRKRQGMVQANVMVPKVHWHKLGQVGPKNGFDNRSAYIRRLIQRELEKK